ncbi:hypothetical protein DL93DRAFT_805598 [Clavulina sp. PMI_390]|nr:hypothetical protein DL93DRAFT_805598 [Clavulina sp. PMI_390]
MMTTPSFEIGGASYTSSKIKKSRSYRLQVEWNAPDIDGKSKYTTRVVKASTDGIVEWVPLSVLKRFLGTLPPQISISLEQRQLKVLWETLARYNVSLATNCDLSGLWRSTCTFTESNSDLICFCHNSQSALMVLLVSTSLFLLTPPQQVLQRLRALVIHLLPLITAPPLLHTAPPGLALPRAVRESCPSPPHPPESQLSFRPWCYPPLRLRKSPQAVRLQNMISIQIHWADLLQYIMIVLRKLVQKLQRRDKHLVHQEITSFWMQGTVPLINIAELSHSRMTFLVHFPMLL